MEPQFRFSYTLTKKDYKGLVQPLQSQVPVTILFVFCFLYSLQRGISICADAFHWPAIVFFGLAFLLLLFFILWKRAQGIASYKHYAARFLDTQNTADVLLTEEAIDLSIGERSRKYAYAQLEAFLEHPASFQLILDGESLFLPKNSLSSDALLDFRLFLAPKVKEKEKSLPRREKRFHLLLHFTILFTVLTCLFLSSSVFQKNSFPEHPPLETMQTLFPEDKMEILTTQKIPNGEIYYIHNQTENSLRVYVWVNSKSRKVSEFSQWYPIELTAKQAEPSVLLPFKTYTTMQKLESTSFGIIYADSALKDQILENNLDFVQFSANDTEYLLYFKRQTEV